MLWYIETVIRIFPAYAANSTPVFLSRFNILGLNRPVDGGRKAWDGRRLLGDGKTWQGLIFGPVVGAVVGYLLGLFGYSSALSGFLLGLGSLLGDMFGSFLKRRLGMPRGANAGLLDSLDFITVALLFSYPLERWKFEEVVFVLVLTAFTHRLSNIIGYKLGLKREPW